MNDILLNVLWVEDRKNIHEAYRMEAASYNINLVPYECWEDAERELKGTSFDKWSAIILDGKCKYRKTDTDKAERFLPQVFSNLSILYREHKHIIPWYILSAGGAEVGPIEDLIIDERLEWDGDWPKKYYSKNTDRSILYQRIRDKASMSNRTQIRTIMYPKLFAAIEEANLNEEVSKFMFQLLEPIHFDVVPESLYNDGFYKARKILEYVFLSMVENGILPPEIKHKSDKGDFNLTWASLFLSGISPHGSGWEYKKTVFDKVTSGMVKSILEITGSYLHIGTRSNKDILNVGEHIKCTDDSPFLLRSVAFQVADFIMWYKDYLDTNSDKDDNTNYWSTK